MTSPFATAYDDLTRLGYRAVPLIDPACSYHQGRGKAPGAMIAGGWRGIDKWQRFREEAPSSFDLKLWRGMANANVGLIMGTSARDQHVISVDVDTIDPDALDLILSTLPASPMIKRGAKGETRFYRASKDIKTRCYNDDRIPHNAGIPRRLVDLLTGFDTRHTVVPPSVHPDTGKPYVWVVGPVAAADLPAFTADDLEKLEDTLKTLGWGAECEGAPPKRERKPAPVDADDIWSEVKAAAMADLGAWVPDLDLYGLRRARQGYEAVATWRASSTGRPIAQRKRNLSIQPNGITDFGTNDTYSSIDLVMAARDCSQAEATDWLRERLGLKDEGVVIALQPKVSPVVREPETFENKGVAEVFEPAFADLSAELPDALTRLPGALGACVDWIEQSGRRPSRVLALGAALVVFGTAAGRKIAGPTLSGTHLFALGLAGTGSAKDHPLNAIPTLLAAAGMHRHIGRAEFMSHQAVYRDLMREPLTCCPMDEFGSFLRKINNRNSSGSERAITGVLRTAWGKSFATMPAPGWATQGSEPIHSPALSLYGMSTPSDFYTAIEGADVTNGFLNRFLILATSVRPEPRDPLVSKHVVPEGISQALADIYAIGGPLASSTMHNQISTEPLQVIGWDMDSTRKAFELFEASMVVRADREPLVARTAEMAIRLATIRALGRDGLKAVVTHDDLRWGIELASWSAERMIRDAAEHMSESAHQADAKKILKIVRDRGRVAHSDLMRALQHRLKAREIKDLIDSLKESGEVVVSEQQPPAGGPKAKFYTAA